MDHPDCYRDLDDMTAAFAQYLRLVPANGLIVAGGDSPVVRHLLDELKAEREAPRVITYGLEKGNLWQAVHLEPSRWGGLSYDVEISGNSLGRFTLSIPGNHNVANALAAMAVVNSLGVGLDAVRDVLRDFRGVRRRFEHKGTVGERIIVDDYAHHPTEIRATLAAARQVYPDKPIWAVFQPHTYSRTLALMDDFANSFADADHVIVTDIYAAREHDTLGVSAEQLVERMKSHPDARHIASLDDAVDWLIHRMEPNALLITLGAGDGYRVGENVLTRLRRE